MRAHQCRVYASAVFEQNTNGLDHGNVDQESKSKWYNDSKGDTKVQGLDCELCNRGCLLYLLLDPDLCQLLVLHHNVLEEPL